MKNLKCLPYALFSMFVIVSFHVSVSAQTTEDKNRLATISTIGSGVRWDVVAPYSELTMTVSAPDGRVFRKEFKEGSSPEFVITDKRGERLPDGQYAYELRLTPVLSAGVKESLAAARGKDDDAEEVRATRKRGSLPALVQSGTFSILNGAIIVAGAQEEPRSRPTSKLMEPSQVIGSGNAVTKNQQQHHPLLIAKPDDVIPDDLIVQGSACVGLDCVNGEVFGFDTIRLKENNDRIQFDDTSTAAGFPTNNWQIRANSSASGGASFLGFVDQGPTGNSETGTVVFEVDAGAPANSLKVSSTGRVGLRTATPVLDLHMNTGDTPAMRFEQNSGGGFTAQTWDVAGNEANFFVRDVTGGSRLPFRIRPGAPTSSIDISATGNVGIGTASPAFPFDVSNSSSSVARFKSTAAANAVNITLDAAATRNANIEYQQGGTNKWFEGNVASNDRFRLANSTANGNAEVFSVLQTGSVGIGTTAPDQKLSVNGDASKVGGGSWQVFSDERLKNIRGNFNRGLKAVMQLQPLRYEYRQANALGLHSDGEHIGFGAQSVQKVIPEAVISNNQGYLLVNNDPILWTMLNAIKEQQKEIEQLKGQVKQLRAASRKRK
jgi:hypothetical protein